MKLAPVTVTVALFLVTMAVNLQVPLYPVYAERASYGTGLTTVVFALYVAGLLPVLILFGGVSDRVGRKPVLLAGLLAAFTATLLMVLFPTMQTLFLARVLQGVGVGLSVGTGTAYLAELLSADAAPRAAAFTALTTSLGFGGGALLTSTVLWIRPSPVPLSYWLVLSGIAATLLLVLCLPSLVPVGGALVRLPAYPPSTLSIGLGIAVAWAVTGLVISVVPTQLAHYGLAVWAGPALFLVNGTGALLQPLARRMSAERSLLVGFALLPLGYGLLVLGAAWGVLSLVLLGSSVAGAACYGFTYLGGLAAVTIASGKERARAVSGYFLFAYLGFGLPSILIGFLADRLGAVTALVVFMPVLMLACAVLAYRSLAGVRRPAEV